MPRYFRSQMKMFLVSLALCFALGKPVSTTAQPASESEVPDKAEVVKFLDLMHARAQMAVVLEGMQKQMRSGAEDGFKQKVPDATP
jgi:hypothetical protein